MDQTRITKIRVGLEPEMKMKVIQFLKNNQDVFAWSHEDMLGIDKEVIVHCLSIDPMQKPVQQKRWVFALECNKAIMEEVDKLLAAKFIREVYYPEWQANVVMAKKSNGEWRMCVDFTNLNKTCLKNSFPLPQIDQLVDLTARHEHLSFMDAFSSYNQIMTDKQDQEKIAFIASQGLYCHKVMPFGLKTASAT